jgi:transcription elongation factor Elf1
MSNCPVCKNDKWALKKKDTENVYICTRCGHERPITVQEKEEWR